MLHFTPNEYELVSVTEEENKGDTSPVNEMTRRAARVVRKTLRFDALRHCGMVCAGLVDNTSKEDKLVAVRTVELLENDLVSHKYLKKVFRSRPVALAPLQDVEDIEVDALDSDVEIEKQRKDDINMVQQNLRNLVNFKEMPAFSRVEEIYYPSFPRAFYEECDLADKWNDIAYNLKQLHPTTLDELDAKVKTLLSVRSNSYKERRERNFVARVLAKDNSKFPKVDHRKTNQDENKGEEEDDDDERVKSDEENTDDEHAESDREDAVDSDALDYSDGVDDSDDSDNSDDGVDGNDSIDSDSNDDQYLLYESDDESDWEAFTKPYDPWRHVMKHTVARWRRKRSLHQDYLDKVFPGRGLPQWLKSLGQDLFHSLGKDEAFLKSLDVYTDGPDEQCGSLNFDRVLYERRNLFFEIRSAISALAIFVLILEEHAHPASYEIRSFLSSKVKCDLLKIVFALDVFIERRPLVTKKDGQLILKTSAFSC